MSIDKEEKFTTLSS